MKRLVITFTVMCVCISAFARPNISVSDLYPSNVKGRLGKPLGSRTIIAGRFTAAMLSNPLNVTEIDGTAVTNNIIISIRSYTKSNEIELKKGVFYRFEGYESGEFAGPPDWLGSGAQQPFQFHSVFVVTSVLKPKLDQRN
jgi:hypothetical protein